MQSWGSQYIIDNLVQATDPREPIKEYTNQISQALSVPSFASKANCTAWVLWGFWEDLGCSTSSAFDIASVAWVEYLTSSLREQCGVQVR